MTHPSEQAGPAILLTAAQLDLHFHLTPGTVRKWAYRYPMQMMSADIDEHGRALYALIVVSGVEKRLRLQRRTRARG